MSEKNEQKTIRFLDMAEACEPKESFSPYSLKSKWRVVPYDSEFGTGNMLLSFSGKPEDITFSPKLEGWYKIYIFIPGSSKLTIKLSGDGSFRHFGATYRMPHTLERLYWRCADMTDQSIIITKKIDMQDTSALVSGFEFVPMTEEEIAEWKYEHSRTDTKRIYATDDMHNRLIFHDHKKPSDWFTTLESFDHSDVEWFSIEQIRTFVSGRLPTKDIDEFAFYRACDKFVQSEFPKYDYDQVLKDTVDYGHKKGLKMSVSLRMGAWGMMFPFDQFYFDTDLYCEHPEWRTYDRNGDLVSAMSYAYEGVQDYMVNELVNMARSGCDAVTLIAHRGIPYVLFEKPVLDRFYELYGEDARELPLDEPRLNKLHCDIMIEFFRKVRAALDKEFGKDKIEIHLRTLFSVYDTKVIALDCERLCAEGLINAIISYPQRHYEKLDGDIWQEGKEWRIDLDKYTADIRNRIVGLTSHTECAAFEAPYTNYRGEVCGPKTHKEMVDQWMDLEKKYGVKVYLEIMPRTMPPAEFKRRALELYELGAERFGLWDTYGRVGSVLMWNIAGKIGHKDELKDIQIDETLSSVAKTRKLADFDCSRYNPNWGG